MNPLWAALRRVVGGRFFFFSSKNVNTDLVIPHLLTHPFLLSFPRFSIWLLFWSTAPSSPFLFLTCPVALLSSVSALDKQYIGLEDRSPFFLLLSTLRSWQSRWFITPPRSRTAHSSPLSATSSFAVWTPSCGRALLHSKTVPLLIRRRTGSTGSPPNPTAGFNLCNVWLVHYHSGYNPRSMWWSVTWHTWHSLQFIGDFSCISCFHSLYWCLY